MKKIISTTVLLLTVAALYWGCIKEEETGTIYGTVTDFATGEPVKNANVKLLPNGEATKTGSDGTYSFQDLKPGEYSLSFSKAEYADLDDDYVITLSAGKSVCRDVQMKKEVAQLRITDMAGNTLTELDFGAQESITSKSFNIFNNGTQNITCELNYECQWITSVTNITAPINPGQTVTITVVIDRTRLAGGENTTLLHIVSNNGSNEIKVKATGADIPTVTTANVTGVTATSASCGGNVTADGGTFVTDRGICWAMTNAPTIEGSHVSMGQGTGSFNCTMNNLSLNTKYYVRAFATNNRGTAYGEQKTFTTTDGLPKITTTAVSNISATTAQGGGNVTDNGGYPITARGICWNTTGYPDINASHTTNGTGNGSFTANMSNLSPNTTYHVRAYATNSVGTSYGSDVTFSTTDGLPVITISAVTNIMATSAVLNANITNDYGSAITERGFCWSMDQNPTVTDNSINVGTGTGAFNGSATNLKMNTTYYVRAYARNSHGLNYSSQISFQTTDGLPTVTTTTPTKTGTTVTTGGNVTSNGGFAVSARGVCYGTTPYPDLSSSHNHTSNGSGTGSFLSTFNMPSTGIYYIRAYATNANGTSYGEQVTINHPYNDLPTFTYGGQTYRVAPAATTTMIWINANNYCNNLTLYGYSDWRLPSISELEIMHNRYKEIGGFNNSDWWSMTQCSYGHDCVDFGTRLSGQLYCNDDDNLIFVRPIRVEN